MTKKYYDLGGHWLKFSKLPDYDIERYLSAINLVPDDVGSLVDVGCGNGLFLSGLESRFGSNVRMIGYDGSITAIKNKVCQSEIICAQIEELIADLGSAEGSIDLISCMAVLEHLSVSVASLLIAKINLLSPKYILINLPYREIRTRVRCRYCNCGFDPHLHLRSYDIKDIEGKFPEYRKLKELVLWGGEPLFSMMLRFSRIEIAADFGGNKICPQCGEQSGNKAISDFSTGIGSLGSSLIKKVKTFEPKLLMRREFFLLLGRGS